MPQPAHEAFAHRFARVAASVSRWLALRALLTGLGLGLIAGAAFAGAAYALGRGEPRLAGALACACTGLVFGAWLARKQRLSREEIALYLDRRLASDEVISTAVESSASHGAARAVVVTRAAAALAGADAKRTRPKLLSRAHALIPSGAALLALMVWLPLPAAPPGPPPAPGSDLVVAPSAPELDRLIEGLDSTRARDPEQQKRLDELSRRARQLRDKLRAGAPRRDVQAELSALAEGLTAERMDLGSGERRRGFEAALAKLRAAGLEPARKALADRDLTELDEKMDRAARELERSSRDRARKALEEAAEAARKEGAEDVARMLEEQKKRFERVEKEAEQLRELSRALGDRLPDEARKDLERMNSSGDREAEKRLAEAMARALSTLGPEERARLAERIAQELARQEGQKDAPQELSPEMKKQLEQLAKELATEEGIEKLAEELRKRASNDHPPGSEAERQEQLQDAERQLAAARAKLGAPPGGSSAQPGGSASRPGGLAGGPGGSASRPGGGGPGPGGGPGGARQNASSGPASSAAPLRAHVSSKLNPGAPMPGNMPGRTQARPGETANLHGTGALGQVGPDEISGVSESDVPDEYREQVGRYFQP